ncbi:MAG: ABC transporter substrate-binding protein [Clostridiales Family XIII bacterium]|jgi:peptide/nickel transport system substrate-binding protein|nr:ABC transporter substrate-binding protein [Clostridiales Family XIII bacterium]
MNRHQNKNAVLPGAIALLLVLVLALAGCGGNGTEDPSGTAENSPGTASSDALVVGIPGEIATLDVNQEAGILNYYLAAIANEGLVSIGNDGKVVPALAETWDSQDATVWTFKLREDAKFWDGSPVTADDVIWSIERARDPERSPGVVVYFPEYVQTVEKTGDYEIKVTLDGAHAGFIWAMSNAGGLFVNKKEWGEAAESIGSPGDLLMGSGPYKATEFEPGSHATFEAVDTWWGGALTIPTIRFDFIKDAQTMLLAFTQGDLDFALNIPVDQSEQWEQVEGAKVEYVADRSYYGITFDQGVAPFDDIHVRKAFSYAIDAQGIIDGSILKGHASPATAITPPEQFAAAISLDEAKQRLAELTHYAFDLAKAKEELAQSKVPDGFETTIYYPDAYQNTGKASLVIADALKQIGVTLDVKEIPLDQWLGEVGDGKQGAAWMIYFPTTAEPGEIAGWLLSANGPGSNPANWQNDEVAVLTDKVMSAASLEDEVDPAIEGNEIAQQNAIYAPVWWGQSAVAYQGAVTVQGYNSYTLISQNWPQHFTLQ